MSKKKAAMDIKRQVHMSMHPDTVERFRENCRRARLDMTRATELLWQLWDEGRISISTEVAVVPRSKAVKAVVNE